MFLHFLPVRKFERFRHVEAGVFGPETLLLDPLFDNFLVAHNFDARLEDLERHAGKTLGMQLAQLVLIIVMVRRARMTPLMPHCATKVYLPLGGSMAVRSAW